MNDFIHLTGTEDVARAGRNISQAADKMASAASSIEYSLDRVQTIMNDFIQNLETLIEKITITKPPTGIP